jgi:hypothetical protein
MTDVIASVERDPEYDWIPPLKEATPWQQRLPRGAQCGECGMKFEYRVTYGYHCPLINCPRRMGKL